MKDDEYVSVSNDSSAPNKKKDKGPLHQIHRFFGRLKLRTVLTLLFGLVVVLAICITGLLAFQNSQYSANELAGQLQHEVANRISDQLDSYLQVPHFVNQLSIDSFKHNRVSVHDTEDLKEYFLELSHQFDTVEAICYGHEKEGNYTIISKVGSPGLATGKERYYGISNQNTNFSFVEYHLFPDGQTGEKTITIPDYDPRTRPWYQEAVQAKEPVWTPIYMWLEGIVSIDAVRPVYSDTGELLGVMDTALTLSGISDFLQKIEISPHGQAFIIEKSGVLVASSTVREPYVNENGTLVRLSASACKDPVIQRTSHYLLEHLGNQTIISSKQFQCDYGGTRQLVQISPYQDQYGLDWLIVVVIPESDIMGSIYAHNQITFIFLICAIIGTIILCIFLARYITKPVLSMNRSAKALARGDFSLWTDLDRDDELGELSHSFSQMAVQLRTMFSSLKASEERYLSLFQSSADAIFLLDTCTLLEMNRAAEEMFQISAVDACGKEASSLFDEIGPVICEMINSYRLENNEYLSKTISRINNDGEQYLNIQITKIPEDNRILSLVHIRDITKERQAIISFAEQEALQKSFSQIQMILQLLPDPTFVIDADGHVLFWNRAFEKLTGYSSASMIGKGDYEYSVPIHGIKRPVLIDLVLHPEISSDNLYDRIEQEGDIIKSSFWVDISGDMKYISAIAACLYDSTGTNIGAIETIRDITTLKQAEEALLVANNKLNLLSSITRHDILNKIMISKAYLSFIEEIDLNPDQKTYMDAIKRSLSEIEHFVSFSKTYQELGMKVPEWQDVGEIFRRAEKEIDTGNITVNIAISGIFILVDPLFEKVCYNLIENAIRHGEKLTRIDITSYEANTGLLIKIKDDGVGIPDDQKKLIFERGFGKNTGYGLFLTREILSISSITISEQGSFGDGCLFVIDVPKGKYHIDEQS